MTVDKLLSQCLANDISRRKFLKWSAAVGGTTALASGGLPTNLFEASSAAAAPGEVRVLHTACSHNCGGRCVLNVWVRDDQIIRITTDDRPETDPRDPQLRACQRGRSYRRRVYHPDRLKVPMKRIGPRGSGEFEQISWDEATSLVAEAMQRIKEQYGNAAFLNHYASGGGSQFLGSGTSERLLNLFGGFLGEYGSYSAAAFEFAAPITVGGFLTGNSRDDWQNSKLIVLFGFNPMEMIAGTNTMYYLRQAKDAGARVIVIDPRMSMTGAWADEWIPIRPGTDTALIAALAHVMISENLHDQEFLNTYTSGFDDAHLPEGIPNGNSYKAYVMGTKDGTPKTPEWAEAITGISRNRIVQLAREIAMIKPTAIYQGWGGQRRAYGEQFVRAGITLAAMTGNIGISGGSAGTFPWDRFMPVGGFPGNSNPQPLSISTFTWTDAIVRGTEMGAADGVRGLADGQETLPTNVKFIYNTAGNTLINQHADANRTSRILADESLVEFIVVHDQFLTPSARFADVLLPSVTWMETVGMTTNWLMTDSLYYMPKVIEPMFECRSDYQICTEIAGKLGLSEAYTEGKSEEEWIDTWVAGVSSVDPTFDNDEWREKGVHIILYDEPTIALKAFRDDPEANPLPTESGKIEVFSTVFWNANDPDEAPAVAKYIPEWEGHESPLVEQYPLQLIGHHYHRRAHSTHDNIDWMSESMPQRLFMNPVDAEVRGIRDGDLVRVFNDRGEVRIPVRITQRILPGVVDLPQGAWYNPDANGVDVGGCINTLTSHKPTPLAKGTTQHTALVQVARA